MEMEARIADLNLICGAVLLCMCDTGEYGLATQANFPIDGTLVQQ